MKTKTNEKIINILKNQGAMGPSAIASELEISTQMVHRHLKKLVEAGKIKKQGTPPTVLYLTVQERAAHTFPELTDNQRRYIEQHYLAIKPDGEVISGLEGFEYWSLKTKQQKQFKKLATEYIATHQAFNTQYRNDLGVIDATFKIKDTFDQCYLDFLFYQEFYSLPKFGKTKTGQLVFLGKSGQSVEAIRLLAEQSYQSIINIINYYKIDGIIFTPHSIPRRIAFLKKLQQFLKLPKPTSTLKKIFVNDIPIPQKSLSKLSDRIENATNTIFTSEENNAFKRILVIDDAVGSGATLNIIAHKLKQLGHVEFVCGFAVTGSLKGFEVINEI